MRLANRTAAILLAGTVLLAGCASGSKSGAPTDGKGDGKLVVSTFGFGADKVEQYVIKPFEEKYGIDVILETGANADRYNKVKANKANPVVDVVLMTDYFAQQGIEEGLFQKVDASKVPNLAKLYDWAPNKDGYGPIYTVNRLGIVYRTDLVTTPPTSWKDLFKDEYKGKLAMPDLTTSYGMPMISSLAETYGKDNKDAEAAFTQLKGTKANVLKFWAKTSEVTSLIQQGEAAITPAADIFFIDLLKNNEPVKWIVPEEGSYLVANTVQIVSGTKRSEAAHQFVDFLLSPEIQADAARHWNDAPVNKETKLEESVSKYLAYGEEGFKGFKTLDQAFILANRNQWVDRFMREVAN